jgi:catechol-2,3-dioxygenase
MKKRHVCAVACSLAISWSTAALAQLAPANDVGVALGHIHLAVKDVEANTRFFTTMLGGKLVKQRTAGVD